MIRYYICTSPIATSTWAWFSKDFLRLCTYKAIPSGSFHGGISIESSPGHTFGNASSGGAFRKLHQEDMVYEMKSLGTFFNDWSKRIWK